MASDLLGDCCSFCWVFSLEASCSKNNQEEEDGKSPRFESRDMKQDISQPDR